jgi:hypothetical protein
MATVTTTEVHATALLIRIFNVGGFLGFTVIHWQLKSVIDIERFKERNTNSPVEIMVFTVVLLAFSYLITLVYPTISVPGYENPVSSNLILQPVILLVVASAGVLFKAEKYDMRDEEDNRDHVFPSPLTALYVAALEYQEQHQSECTFCGDEIASDTEFYERVTPATESESGGSIDRFCSPLCVAAEEQSQDE